MTEEDLPLCECGCGLQVTKPENRFIHGHQFQGKKHNPESIAKAVKKREESRLKPKPEPQLCECGCCEYALPGNRFISGHENRGKEYWKKQQEPQLCKCGCGELAEPGYDYIWGHNRRGKERSQSERDAISKANEGKPKSQIHRESLSEAFLREKDPLPDGQEKSIPENKNCASYLGNIAEELLSRTFKNVKRMPNNNPGFDIICNQNFKIDVKSAATGYKGFWQFHIDRNEIADYFLCIAFESREELIPTYIWLITGKDINHLGGITISKSRLSKWSKYEQPLDKAILCCDEMRS